MSLVTAVKPQKNKRRVNIYLDGKFGFGLDLETFVKNKIKVGDELSEGKIESIVKQGEFQNTYDKILRFATMRPRSEREFKLWLIKHKVHQSIHEELFNRLKRLELLDDKKFASWWLGQRLQFKSKSKRELKMELKIKGVENSIVEEVFSENEVDEKKMIKNLLSKNENKWKSLNGFEKRKKIFGFLAAKGFDYNTIKDVLGNSWED